MTFSSFFFLLKMEADLNPAECIPEFCQFLAAFVFIFICCNIGEMMTNQFKIFDEQLYQCNWYSFSIGMQKIFAIFMSFSRQPAVVHGFGNIEMTRITFKEVLIPSMKINE